MFSDYRNDKTITLYFNGGQSARRVVHGLPVISVLESFWDPELVTAVIILYLPSSVSSTDPISMLPMSSSKSLIKVINNSTSILVSKTNKTFYYRFRAQ